MKKSETVKILVAESSPIIRMGVTSVIRREMGATASTQEVSTPQDMTIRLRSMMPDIVLASPSFCTGAEVEALKTDKALGLEETTFIALLSRLEPTTTTRGYDATINIFDDEEQIMQTIASATNMDDEDKNASNEVETLSARERQVIRGVVRGLSNKEIADEMNISPYTVLTHRRNISRKLQIHSPVALAIYAITNKIATTDEIK